MELSLHNAVIFIATTAALIRFALLEWESVLHAWKRVIQPERAVKENAPNER
jgi:hypothetical protein